MKKHMNILFPFIVLVVVGIVSAPVHAAGTITMESAPVQEERMVDETSEITESADVVTSTVGETEQAIIKEENQENGDTYKKENSKPLITDWLMVIITAIYVIATIIITVENMKAAKTSRDQLDESLRQFDERKRLDAMPYIYVAYEKKSKRYWGNSDPLLFLDQTYNHQSRQSSIVFPGTCYTLLITNIGKGTAKNICFFLDNGNQKFSDERNKVSVMPPNNGPYDITVMFRGVAVENGGTAKADLVFEYSDLFGNRYKQISSFDYNASAISFEILNYSISDNMIVESD